MREITAARMFPYRRGYFVNERQILDVWRSAPGEIVIYFENVIDEPHDDLIRTFLLDDRRLYTQTAHWIKHQIPSWEEFLVNPTSHLVEMML